MGNIKKLVREIIYFFTYKKSDNPIDFESSTLKKNNISNFEKKKFITQNQWLEKFNFTKIIDIGANEGQAAERFRALLPQTPILSFEPLPEPFKVLNEIFANDANFQSFNFALGDKTGSEFIYLNDYSPSSSILKMDEEHKKHFKHTINTTNIEIQIKQLDQLKILKENDITLVKIDVQGFEKFVLLGGEQTIKKCKLVIVELSFKKLYENEPLFDEVYQIFKSFGFKYIGSFEQLLAPSDFEVLQQDAIFLNENL